MKEPMYKFINIHDIEANEKQQEHILKKKRYRNYLYQFNKMGYYNQLLLDHTMVNIKLLLVKDDFEHVN